LTASQHLLAEHDADVRRLQLKAPQKGYVLPPPESQPYVPTADGLARWTGEIFEPRNQGCYVEPGTILCRIGDPTRLEAELVVEHRDLSLVTVGQQVDIMLDAPPGRPISGTISELGESIVNVTPKRLSQVGGGELSSKIDSAGVERPRHTSYYARVALAPTDAELLRLGIRGRAKIQVGSATLFEVADRYLRNLFTFRM